MHQDSAVVTCDSVDTTLAITYCKLKGTRGLWGTGSFVGRQQGWNCWEGWGLNPQFIQTLIFE